MLAIIGAALFSVLTIVFCVALLVSWVYGLVLTIRASLLLTVLCFLVHVPFIVFGLVKIGFGVDLPKEIVDALRSRR